MSEPHSAEGNRVQHFVSIYIYIVFYITRPYNENKSETNEYNLYKPWVGINWSIVFNMDMFSGWEVNLRDVLLRLKAG